MNRCGDLLFAPYAKQKKLENGQEEKRKKRVPSSDSSSDGSENGSHEDGPQDEARLNTSRRCSKYTTAMIV